jgi:hypothetical protein
MPLNKFRRFVRSSQMLSDVMFRSVVAPCGSPHFPEWSVESQVTQNVLALTVLILGCCEHCFWRLVRKLMSEWAVVTKMLFTLISQVLLHLLQLSQNAYMFQQATVEEKK